MQTGFSTSKLDTTLDAVNLCLQGVGRQPVPTLDTSDLDVAQALASLDNVIMDVLDNGGFGWWFNFEEGWEVKPDPYNGQIAVPNDVLTIIDIGLRGESLSKKLVVRSNRVYDKIMHTFDLRERLGDSPLQLTYVRHMPFEDMPTSAKRAIAWKARTLFCWDVEGDQAKFQVNEGIANQSMQLLNRNHTSQQRYNYMQSPMMKVFEMGAECSGFNLRGF